MQAGFDRVYLLLKLTFSACFCTDHATFFDAISNSF
jgi:hypothetical protein